MEYPHVNEKSFTSTVSVILNPVNAVITVPAGTELNYDSNDDGVNDSFKVICNYIYRVANKPGDDTTLGSGRITIHYQRGIYATDQFDTTQVYPLNSTLYVGFDGKLTSKQPTEDHPGGCNLYRSSICLHIFFRIYVIMKTYLKKIKKLSSYLENDKRLSKFQEARELERLLEEIYGLDNEPSEEVEKETLDGDCGKFNNIKVDLTPSSSDNIF